SRIVVSGSPHAEYWLMTVATKNENCDSLAAGKLDGACIVCGTVGFRSRFEATDRLYRTTDRRFHIVECRCCSLLRLSPQPPADELRRYYPADYWFAPEPEAADRLSERYRRLVARDHVGFVHRALRSADESGPILDIGCGGGLLLRLLAERGY